MERKPLEILVVEDNERYMRDAQLFFGKAENCKVDYAGTYREALEKGPENYDAVITDVFIPESEGGGTEPYGLNIADRASEKGVPPVFITDIEIHWERRDVLGEIREKSNTYDHSCIYPGSGGVGRVDFNTHGKPWDLALTMATYLVTKKEHGEDIHVGPGKYPYDEVLNELRICWMKGYYEERLKKERLKELIEEIPELKEAVDTYCRRILELE